MKPNSWTLLFKLKCSQTIEDFDLMCSDNHPHGLWIPEVLSNVRILQLHIEEREWEGGRRGEEDSDEWV